MNYSRQKADSVHDHASSLQYVLPPYKHQRDAINATVSTIERFGGAALFVDMGLGKSMIALHVARILHRRHGITRILVICPKGIMSVWKAEFQKHLKQPPTMIVWDTKKSKTKIWQRSYARAVQSNGVVIGVMNVDAFQTENKQAHEFAREFRNGFCILDESTNIKTPRALRTKTLLKYAETFSYRVIMTGTEITNTVLDLYAQFAFAVPGIWNQNYYSFRARYAIMQKIPVHGGRTVEIVVGFRKIDELMEHIQPYLFRARKEDCFDLPEKIYTTIPVTMNRAQQTAYHDLQEQLFTEYKGEVLTVTQVLTQLLRFHQITGGYFPGTDEQLGKTNPKIQALLADLEDTNEKAIVWCVYKAEVAGVVSALRSAYGDDSTVRFTGNESTAEREQAVEDFRGHARFFVANPQVAGYGLNLQFCTLQYFFSRNRRMDMNKQAEDRSHRIGTQGACVYKTLLVENTVDQTIHESIMKKQTLLEGIQTADLQKITAILGGRSVDS